MTKRDVNNICAEMVELTENPDGARIGGRLGGSINAVLKSADGPDWGHRSDGIGAPTANAMSSGRAAAASEGSQTLGQPALAEFGRVEIQARRN